MPRGIQPELSAKRGNLSKIISPPLTREDRKKAALAAQEAMLRFGITGVRSMERFECWEALHELDEEEALKLRVYHLLPPEQLDKALSAGLLPRNGSEHLLTGQMKLFADGSLGAATALLHAPYTDAPDEYGIPYMTVEELQKHSESAYQHGFDVAIHAIGDKAVTNALDAIEAARLKYPGAWRDSIEHVQLIRLQDLERFRMLGITASMQPRFIGTDWKVAMAKWGAERCRNAYALRTVLEYGVPLQCSSDTPVEPCDPRYGLYAARHASNAGRRTDRELVPRSMFDSGGSDQGLYRPPCLELASRAGLGYARSWEEGRSDSVPSGSLCTSAA